MLERKVKYSTLHRIETIDGTNYLLLGQRRATFQTWRAYDLYLIDYNAQIISQEPIHTFILPVEKPKKYKQYIGKRIMLLCFAIAIKHPLTVPNKRKSIFLSFPRLERIYKSYISRYYTFRADYMGDYHDRIKYEHRFPEHSKLLTIDNSLSIENNGEDNIEEDVNE